VGGEALASHSSVSVASSSKQLPLQLETLFSRNERLQLEESEGEGSLRRENFFFGDGWKLDFPRLLEDAFPLGIGC